MSKIINVSKCDTSCLNNEESIADWLIAREEKGNQFMQKIADIFYEQLKDKE